jgi:hypothetical protein
MKGVGTAPTAPTAQTAQTAPDAPDAPTAQTAQTATEIPEIPQIHQQIRKVTSNPGALRMDTWHTCDTTHCRAGWVVHLAGQEGYELESLTSTEFAAMQIYKNSSPIRVSPAMFYADNKKAMQDIERCAKEEATTKPQQP